MSPIFSLLLVLLFQAAEPRQHRLDLEPLLVDPAAVQKLRILYAPSARKSYQAFYVYGDGSVVWQAFPTQQMSVTGVPTCKNKVSPDKVKGLIRLMIERHFLHLPEKNFILEFNGYRNAELELHTIAVDNGLGKARRTFGNGEYGGKQESIPPDFASIEEELKRLKDSAFPSSSMNCQLAPAITF
jgi:hypothetical protein